MTHTAPLHRVAPALATFLLLGCAAHAPAERDALMADHGVTVSIPARPAPVRIGGRTHLVWELFLHNDGAETVTLTALHVRAGGREVMSYDGAAIAKRWRLMSPAPGSKAPPLPAGAVAPGTVGVVYLWLPWDDAIHPKRIDHRLIIGRDANSVKPYTGTQVTVAAPPEPFGAPVAGAGWLAVNAPSNTSRHRRSVQRIDGELYMAQRYAVDLVRVLGPEGTHTGDPKVNTNYTAYGTPLLAVADGEVVAVRDDLPDNVPGPDSRAVKMTNATLAGNHVVLDVGGGRYVTYAHLKPGSATVQKGQKVSRGQVLGRIGNSGNSTEPHLHLHVCDHPAVLACQGRPYAFEAFTEQPIEPPKAPGEPPKTGPKSERKAALPVELGYLQFPEVAE